MSDRAVRALRRARRLIVVRGREPVDIDRLISPLRYDILVRQSYFELLESLGDRPFDEIVARSRGHAYHTWFVKVMIPRVHPSLVGAVNEVEVAFEHRVAAAVELLASFADSGYDPSRPVTLRAGAVVLRTATGKRVGTRVFAGDGCHRLALLRARGERRLAPGTYRVTWEPALRPLDHTGSLLAPLAVDAESYRGFLCLAYPPGEVDAALEGRPEARVDLLAAIEADRRSAGGAVGVGTLPP